MVGPLIAWCLDAPRRRGLGPQTGVDPKETFVANNRTSRRTYQASAPDASSGRERGPLCTFKACRVRDRLGLCRPKSRECCWCKVANVQESRTSHWLRKKNRAPPRPGGGRGGA